VGRQAAAALYVIAMVAVIVGVDVLFLRHHLLTRLISNVAIVVVFAAVYLLFVRRQQA
jgi:predicted tellurium resistance membrane protein TerC